ncbi:hypothetical protein DO97_14220 [Neosynechococcus sphagnicola sy1]|uniref:Uncharacterized protein n=1 Tax=Neosynechococcus sphagnicola sy1 TaxID=1497020 RepID=A0A098TH53_9CYAN|nr:DUF6166 domain-containing protein [Neosynechococcus sphagnicola]KGF71915.1 hypothetical protein DO97_14220 [Neosynechococcus sphagnicola sy1]
MARLYYHALRTQEGLAQILISPQEQAAAITWDTLELLPAARQVADSGQPGLEWHPSSLEFSQAAIALLAHATSGERSARLYAPIFQATVLSSLPEQGWTLRADQVRRWVALQRRWEAIAHQATLLESEERSTPQQAGQT